MDTKGPISFSSQGTSYSFVIVDAFSHFVVSNPVPHFPLNLLFKHYSIIG